MVKNEVWIKKLTFLGQKIEKMTFLGSKMTILSKKWSKMTILGSKMAILSKKWSKMAFWGSKIGVLGGQNGRFGSKTPKNTPFSDQITLLGPPLWDPPLNEKPMPPLGNAKIAIFF